MSVIWRQIYVVMAANLDHAQVVGGKVSCKGSGKGMERVCQPHGDADRMRQGAATFRTESAFFSLMSHGPLVERGKALSAGKIWGTSNQDSRLKPAGKWDILLASCPH